MHLSDDQFERQMNYEASLHVLSKLHDSGLISLEEFSKITARLIGEYCPIVQH